MAKKEGRLHLRSHSSFVNQWMVASLGLQSMFGILWPLCGGWFLRVAWLALTHVVLVFFSHAMLCPFGLGALIWLE
jgi:hypothetical protein